MKLSLIVPCYNEEKCIELGIPWFLIYKVVNRLIEKVVKYHNVIDHTPDNE